MSILTVKIEPFATDVYFSDNAFRVVLADGREVSAPLEWFPRLRDASEEQRGNIDDGVGICWEDVDEDIETESFLAIQ